MGDIHRNAHVGEVEAVTQTDQRQSDDVMSDKLLEILSGLFELQQQHNRLLSPVTSLEQVIGFEDGYVLSVRETLKHGRGVEVPDIRLLHHVQTERPKDRKVHGCVDLLHESSSLSSAANATVCSPWANHALHQKLPCERQDNSIEADKSKVQGTFSVHDRAASSLGRLRVRQEQSAVQRIGRRGINGVCKEDHAHQQER